MKKTIYLISILMVVAFSLGTCTQTVSGQNSQAVQDTLQAHLQKAQLLVQKGRKDEASKILTNIMATNPDNREAVQWWLIANMKRSPTGEVDAIPMLDSLSKSYPSNTGILFYKIFIQAEHNMNKEALANIEKLILVQPDSADNWILKGQILQALDKHSDANTSFDKALELNPSRQDVLAMKASSLSKLGEYEESIALMNKLVEQAPNSAENYYNRACIYCLNGDKKNALADLKKAFSMNGDLKKYALSDADLKTLYDDKEFKELTK